MGRKNLTNEPGPGVRGVVQPHVNKKKRIDANLRLVTCFYRVAQNPKVARGSGGRGSLKRTRVVCVCVCVLENGSHLSVTKECGGGTGTGVVFKATGFRRWPLVGRRLIGSASDPVRGKPLPTTTNSSAVLGGFRGFCFSSPFGFVSAGAVRIDADPKKKNPAACPCPPILSNPHFILFTTLGNSRARHSTP